MTGRHKVPFVPIKTSGTEYVPPVYKGKKERSREGVEGRGEGSAERRRGIGRRSSYDRTDRSDGPGFPLNSQYTIPGNQNEPAFTTSRGRRYPSPVTIRSSLRRALVVVRRNEEGIDRGIRFKGAERDAVETYMYIHMHIYVYMRARARAYVCVYAGLSK